MAKKFYTERDIEDMAARGEYSLTVTEDVVLTELAFEKAERLGVKLIQPHQLPPAAPVGDGTSVKALVIVALAAVGIAAGVVLRRRRRPPAQGQAQETVHRPF